MSTSPQHTTPDPLGPLRSIDSDISALAAGPVIERARRARRIRRTTTAGTTAALVIAAGTVGFAMRPGAADTSPPAAAGVDMVKEAGAAVLKAGSARIDADLSLPAGQDSVLGEGGHASGGVDFVDRTSNLTLSGNLQGRALSVTVLATPEHTYLSNPVKSGSWLELPSANAASDGRLADLDPQTVLDKLPTNSIDTTYVGDEDVRGVPTSHYKATFTPTAGKPGQPFDIWLDHNGLPRRIVVKPTLGTTEVPSPAPSAGVKIAGGLETFTQEPQHDSLTGATLTLEMHDFGKPVTIEAPSPGSISSLADAQGGLEGLLGGKPGS